MNFLWCNRCNKKSEDNILNFNSTENFAKNKRQFINNKNIIKKIDSKPQFPNINISENIQSSINNINNLEEEKEDELETTECSTIELPWNAYNIEEVLQHMSYIPKTMFSQTSTTSVLYMFFSYMSTTFFSLLCSFARAKAKLKKYLLML